MLFARYGHAVFMTHERRSRLLLGARQPNKAARPVIQQLLRRFKPLPPTLRRNLTLDNGTEFSRHHQLTRQLGMATYFCDPHALWQKGGIENAIGRLRRRLPRKNNLAILSAQELDTMIAVYNNTPRKRLISDPIEVFLKSHSVLHFKCDCTFPLSRG
jgi:IS30 family transposase